MKFGRLPAKVWPRMKLGIVMETRSDERRVAVAPATAQRLVQAGVPQALAAKMSDLHTPNFM